MWLYTSCKPHKNEVKSGKQKQSSSDQESIEDLRKLYLNLQKEHKRVQNLNEQNKELAWDLAEWEADLGELANPVSTKDEAIKNMERRLRTADENSHLQSESRGPVTL